MLFLFLFFPPLQNENDLLLVSSTVMSVAAFAQLSESSLYMLSFKALTYTL